MTIATEPSPAAGGLRGAPARVVDIDALFADGPLTRLQFGVLALCMLALFIDGSDIYMVGNLGPAIARGLHSSPANMVQVFVVQQIGLALGAFLISPISDRIGRRRVLLGCFIGFGVLTIGTTFVTTLRELALARGAAGLFMSGVIPNAIALLVETTPRRHRSLFVSLGFAGYAGGAAIGAAIGALLLDRYGWQSGFWLGGFAPLLFVLLFGWMIPESPAFLYSRDPHGPRLRALADRARRDLRGESIVFARADAAGVSTASPFAVLQRNRLVPTLLLWGVFFLSVGTITLSFAWLPTFYSLRLNVPLSTYSAVAAVSLAGGMVGTIAVGALMDRSRPILVVLAFFCVAVLSLLILSQTDFGSISFRLALALMALSLSAGQTGSNAIAAEIYSVEVRSTGVGWAFGLGRIGGIVGPAAGGAMLAAGWSIQSFLLALCVPLALTAILLFLLNWHVRSAAAPASR